MSLVIFRRTVLSAVRRLAQLLIKSIDWCLFCCIRKPEMKIVEEYHPWTRRVGATDTYKKLRCALAGRGANSVDDHCLLLFEKMCDNDERIQREIEYLILSLKEPDDEPYDEPDDIALALREQSP